MKSNRGRRPRYKAPSGGHGSHFKISMGNTDFIADIVLDTFKTPSAFGIINIKIHSKEYYCYIVKKFITKLLSITSIAVDHNITTAYPVNMKIANYKAKIKHITEWKNSIEAWITVQISEVGLTFFALDYYKNLYRTGKYCNIAISAFAYLLRPATNNVIAARGGKRYSTNVMCALLPYSILNKNAFPDEYWFRGQIIDIIEDDKIKLFKPKNKLFKIKVAIVSGNPLEIWVYALKDAIDGEFNIGDYISGIIWIQGFLNEINSTGVDAYITDAEKFSVFLNEMYTNRNK
ncbi:MAG: hypothetical protein HY362_02340 [Candidatus Aenigmarchaeota archaeon]|nr:hypothetical protein [Candidatus Aenigmarchaeota archaeon]